MVGSDEGRNGKGGAFRVLAKHLAPPHNSTRRNGRKTQRRSGRDICLGRNSRGSADVPELIKEGVCIGGLRACMAAVTQSWWVA